MGGTAGQGELLRKGSSTVHCLLFLWKEKPLSAVVQLFWMEDIVFTSEKSVLFAVAVAYTWALINCFQPLKLGGSEKQHSRFLGTSAFKIITLGPWQAWQSWGLHRDRLSVTKTVH